MRCHRSLCLVSFLEEMSDRISSINENKTNILAKFRSAIRFKRVPNYIWVTKKCLFLFQDVFIFLDSVKMVCH